MMKSLFSIVADNIIRDADRNTVSVIDVIEQINISQLPTMVPRVYFFSMLERREDDETDFDCSIVVSQKNKRLIEQPVKIQFNNKIKTRFIFQINGLPIEQIKDVAFAIWHKEKRIAQTIIPLFSVKEVKIIKDK